MECYDSDLAQGLLELLDEDEECSENTICYILFCVLSALDQLHSRHVLHRGVRAENILFNIYPLFLY